MLTLEEIRSLVCGEGLEVDMFTPADPATVLQTVASGRDDFGISYQVEVLLARQEEVPVVSVMGLVQHPLNILMSLEESGIDRPRKLKGKKVGYPGIAYDVPLLKTMLEHDGASIEEVELVNVGFSLVPALDGGPHLAAVDAVTDTTLYTIPCERFQRIMRDHPEVALAVMEHLAAEVRRLSDMVEDLALHTVRTRLARFLLSQADGTQPSIRWTQEEVAAQIGTVRDVVGRALRAFADDGLIRRERGRLVVMDRAGLEREAMMNG